MGSANGAADNVADGAADNAAVAEDGAWQAKPTATIAANPSSLAVVKMFCVHLPSRTPSMLMPVRATIEAAA